MQHKFDGQMREKFTTDNKIGLLAVIDENGEPHAVFINTIMKLDETTLAWGQFIQGLSKRLIPERKNIAFLVLNPQMELWRGKAEYDHSEKSGEIFDLFNNKPLFRYNSYFGIECAHLMNLRCVTERETLKMSEVVAGAAASRLAAAGARNNIGINVMNTATYKLFGQLDGLKFIVYKDNDDFPWIVPCIQTAPAGRDKLVFSMRPFGHELEAIPENARVAVFFANTKMQNVMVKGTFRGIRKYNGVKSGTVDLDLVYSPMPPESAVIYPREPLKRITEM